MPKRQRSIVRLFHSMQKTPNEIIDMYKNGMITFLELGGLLREIVCDENISEIMRLLFSLKRPERAFDFIEDCLGLLHAAQSGERIFRFGGPDLNEEEIKDLIKRMSAVEKYFSGEIL